MYSSRQRWPEYPHAILHTSNHTSADHGLGGDLHPPDLGGNRRQRRTPPRSGRAHPHRHRTDRRSRSPTRIPLTASFSAHGAHVSTRVGPVCFSSRIRCSIKVDAHSGKTNVWPISRSAI